MRTAENKILVVDNSTGTTGAFKSILAFAKALRSDFIFHFAVQQNSPVSEILGEEGFPFVEVPFLEIGKNLKVFFYVPQLIINSRRIAGYCRVNGINVIHINDLFNMTGAVVKFIAPNIKVVYHVRLLPTSYAGKLYRSWKSVIHRYADELIAVSGAVEEAIRKRNSPLKVTIIYDFIPLVQQRGPQAPEVTFLYPANFTRGKGHDFALDALANVLKANANCTLRFAGGDLGLQKNKRFRQALENRAIEKGILGSVSFQDWVADIEQLMKSSEIVLNFSESESFSMVCYEAMVFGRPLIASDCGGPGELIDNSVTGLLVPNRDLQAMSKAMLSLAQNESLRTLLGAQASMAISRKVEEHGAIARLKSIYERVLEPG